MACFKYQICLLFLLWSVNMIYSQECIESGKSCVDHWQCCGGCCFSNICTDTYRDCTEVTDLCKTHYCPPGTDCVLYKPPHCDECEVRPVCELLD